jgi:hypothetical protein
VHLGCLEVNVAEIVQEKRVDGCGDALKVVPARKLSENIAMGCGPELRSSTP